MSDDFMERLTGKVVELFPVREGESLEEYCARGRVEPARRRIFIAAALGQVSKEIRAERQLKKNVWIAKARLAFCPSEKKPCVVCGKYEDLVEAHHVVPLNIQFDAGARRPLQEYDWLCPTHHAAQHVFIEAIITHRNVTIRGLPAKEVDALDQLNTRFVKLFVMLPTWQKVRNKLAKHMVDN